ncbi:MAG: hypothetical protein IJH96_02665 [Ruminococcus sp.]|nr:hypothetical protein [Ruminococcus sp.]
MKKSKIISAISAAVMICSATTVSLVPASATTALDTIVTGENPDYRYIQVCISNEWKSENARFAAYFFNERTGKGEFKNLTDYNRENNKYILTVPDGYTHVIFLRLPQAAPNDFENALHKTNPLELGSVINNTYHINGWEIPVDQEENDESEKLFVSVSAEWQSDNARFAAYFINEATGETEWKDLKCYGRATVKHIVSVSENYTHVIFVRLSQDAENDFKQAWNKTDKIKISDLADNSYEIKGWEHNAWE